MSNNQYFGLETFFNEDVKFYKDVYVYGNFYTENDIQFDNVKIDENLEVFGNGKFYNDINIDGDLIARIITATKRLDVGVGGTTLRADAETGKVGIGTTIAKQELDVVGTAIVSEKVGIATLNPQKTLDVNGIAIISERVGIGSTEPEQKLDVSGSVKIDEFIYDSVNSPGSNGFFLSMDQQGIRWVSFEPSFTEGVFIQDEGVTIPITGIAQSFTSINFKQLNSFGIGTDTIIPIPNPNNPTLIADIQSKDFWGFNDSGNIYRMTKVGIQTNAPITTLDISGSLHATEDVFFDLSLTVIGPTILNNTLDVTGSTTLSDTLGVTGPTTLNNTLDVTGPTTLSDTLGVTGPTTLNNTLDVTGSTTLNNTLDVTGSTTLSDTLGVTGSTTLNNTLDVTGSTTLSDTLDVTGETKLNSTLKVGIGGTVITTTEFSNIGFGTISPTQEIDFNRNIRFQKSIYDKDNNVGYIDEFYEVPRNVLTSVSVDTTGNTISGRFYDAANLIRLNLDFIANEVVGFLTSTDYKNPAFVIPTGNPDDCKDDIKDILKSITYDITRGGNSHCVGAGLSYYNGEALQHITGEDINGYSVKEATIVAITTAAQIARYVINNLTPPVSYQGISSIPIIKDLTLQDDPNYQSNIDPDGCANVVSAINVCAGIVTTIIDVGLSASGITTTYPDGKIVWSPPGADSKNIIYVSKYGNDDNNGRTEGSAKLTIGAAAKIAQPGDTIMIRSGIYTENNPIGLRNDVTITGQDLRLVTVRPLNPTKDVFHVRRGCLIENINFSGISVLTNHSGCSAVAFPPIELEDRANSGYIAAGPATEGPTGRWRSPYIRNCTNFMTGSIGMKINGDHATASTIGNDLKSMVCDSFTQYNENGIGVSITNNGYAQLVSIFTINCNIGIYCDTGGSCDLTNSNSSFGNYGLYAVGIGSTEFTGTVGTYPPTRGQTGVDGGSDTVTFENVENLRRPYDGQTLFFKIDLGNYPDTVGTGVITDPMMEIQEIVVTNGGSGYSASSPPTVLIRDSSDNSQQPKGPQGIIAELSPTIDEVSGAITAIDVVNSGRNYLSTQNLEVFIDGGSATAEVITRPIYYVVDSATENSAGITTVTFTEFIPYELFGGEEVSFRRISRILTSSHSFEYIGAGTDINTATPFTGGVPIKANEIVALDGAQIPFTSTDQKGNFDIGEGFQINQPTATIRGRDFSKAIQAEVTPLILALR